MPEDQLERDDVPAGAQEPAGERFLEPLGTESPNLTLLVTARENAPGLSSRSGSRSLPFLVKISVRISRQSETRHTRRFFVRCWTTSHPSGVTSLLSVLRACPHRIPVESR